MKKFQYIGNHSICSPSERYTLEVEDQEFEMMRKGEMTAFTGTVIEAGKRAPYGVGYRSWQFVNPYVEMKSYGWPVFVKID